MSSSIFNSIEFVRDVLPNECFGPNMIQVADESSKPCIKITGCLPGLAIRCTSKIYPKILKEKTNIK